MIFHQALLVVLTKDKLKKVRVENKKGGLLSLVGHSHEDSAYLCSCNGSVEYSYQGKSIFNEAAHYAALECSKEKKKKKEKMRLHSDIEIFDHMYKMGQSEKSVK